MDIKIIDDFLSKTGLRDFENILDEPRWSIVKHISASYNKGAGLQRQLGYEDDHFDLSLYPIHVISKLLDKEYSCARMRLRVTWPSDDIGSAPHIDEADSDYMILMAI